MKRKSLIFEIVIAMLFIFSFVISAQGELAAVLEVLDSGVQVQRVNTTSGIAVSVEAIVGVGDVIRTDETGKARITFFADGTDVILEPQTEYRITEFTGDDTDFQLSVEVISGQVTQRLKRTLGAKSSYNVETPGMTLAARGTQFIIRVEESGRSAALTREGTIHANSSDSDASIPPDFGIRSGVGHPLSDVVPATTFDQLDAALDGCSTTITNLDDVSLNVRLGPAIDRARVGTLLPGDVTLFMGISEGGDWYRLPFKDGFGWILGMKPQIESGCAGLRVYPNNHIEDVGLYKDLSSEIDISNIESPETTPEPASGS